MYLKKINNFILFLTIALGTLISGFAAAQLPTSTTVVGDVVTHPVTGVDAIVVSILDNSVLTDVDDVILFEYAVGDNIADPNDPNVPPAQVAITAVTLNGGTGLAEAYTLDTSAVIDVTWPVDTTVPAGAVGAPGDPGGPVAVAIPTGNNVHPPVKLKGSRGGDGNDGYGIEICDPFGILGCAIIGYSGTDGGDGGTGPTVNVTTTTSNGPYESISNELSTVTGISIGGDGGTGGDAYGNISARAGGDAGNGGTVNINSSANLTTRGTLAHGIYGQSRSGFGGDGGTGYLFGSGGSGGTAAHGGAVNITNNGDITTFGEDAIGIFGQSIGGAAGNGGDSWGLVGSGGSSRAGGNGGTVTVTNNGNIITSGLGAHGILAESVGGTGGNGGDAGGVIAFGGSGSAGGNGGTANGNMGASATIRTIGDEAHGMFVQSIGGGGGNGGGSGGVVAFGGTGSAGGSGGTVNVNNAVGGQITTEGLGSYAVLAQSIGGGGGDGGTAGAVVALGGNGSAAGNGGVVTVNNGAELRTVGDESYGLIAQSIGGGGGTARGTGGVVALGGDGGSSGAGGTVNVENNARIQTDGNKSDAIVVQSIGGGGGTSSGSDEDGAGGASGGVVSIGGAGSSGGAGGSVSLINNAQVTTLGKESRGLYAQSVGGGGGFGGDSGGLVSIGGRGSSTSNGGTVSLTNTGEITTNGKEAHAIEAQSIGGGGGDGGTSGGAFFTLGGSGSGGGSGSTVTVNNSQNLSTSGKEARGILAQSLGGGGGNGGSSYSGSLFAGVSIGGSAAAGGNGSTVIVNSSDYTQIIDGSPVSVTPLIQTQGDSANGIFAQSLGGGGGNGGLSVQVTGGAFGAASVAVGGTGGGGGTGGAVQLNGNSTVVTAGRDADGVVVQSVGGGGGSGGGAISVAAAGGPGAGSVAVGVGGSGGNGGVGGSVTVNGGGNIRTSGSLAEGFIAQSVGGGGGKGGYVVDASVAASAGGSVAVGVGVGGTGGNGGQGGVVDVTYTGDITTSGLLADAWIAQSVGGGGGHGGFVVSGVIAGSAGGSGGVAVGVGGAGGGGGNASAATGNLTGDVTTSGFLSDGMIVQSVGGGGGNGGFNISGNIAAASGGAVGVSVGVGGAGGNGGSGSTASLTYNGTASTSNGGADAIVAQSVGGGGGQGGLNVSGGISGSSAGSGALVVGVGGAGGGGGNAAAVTANVSGTVSTQGGDSNGVLVQSTGGGGGNGGINVSGAIAGSSGGSGALAVGVGGAGGTGGNGSTADLTFNGTVDTVRSDSEAIVVQSVGGGGGQGAINVSGGISASSGGSGALMVGVGGSGGGGGNSAAVTGNISGTATTQGAYSDGVLIQSAGGGGGSGGLNVSGGIALSSAMSGNVSVGVGGAGGDGGSGSSVNGIVTADITTYGKEARGLVTQSLGGGGGNGGLNVSGGLSISSGGSGGIAVGVGGFGGGGGSGALADLDFTGDVITRGEAGHGILVQSTGGGGGVGALNVSGNVALSSATSVPIAVGVGGFGGSGGSSGDAKLKLTGDTATYGANTDAMTIQSVGGGGGKGGINISGNLGIGFGGTGFGASLGLGGFGGAGGDSGNVNAIVIGDVVASGLLSDRFEADENGDMQRIREKGSNGIIAQSVGGSGGNGGLNVSAGISAGTTSGAFNLGVGGFGGGGGNAGAVDLTATASQLNANLFSATGDNRTAVAAQSIGGGGGHGALNVSGGITGNGQLTVGVGGFGGGGGTASAVTANVTGNISATGSGARGLMVESVGGGGGYGGINISGGINALPGATQPSLIFGLGGFGGAGNSASTVDATQNGAVTVEGRDSIAVLVQSVGGGGGSGALNVTGSLAAGKGFSAAVGIGGSGGLGANAGNVSLISDGVITADGRLKDLSGVVQPDPIDPENPDYSDRANGILVQSIGGGGGNGGLNVTGVIAPSAGKAVTAGVGGSGSGGGDAGTVTVTRGQNQSALLQTYGNQANGLTAQSVGGGGGDAGMNFVAALNGVGDVNPMTALIAIGGEGGDPGHGAAVTVNQTGDINTEGQQSNGLLAQSIGGGGGNAAINIGAGATGNATGVNLAVGGGPGEGGSGDVVDVTHSGNITTAGKDSAAIFAQSVGGGGGNAALSMAFGAFAANKLDVGIGRYGGTGGVGGNVTVDSSGALSTSGDRSVGLLAQSVGNGGGRSGNHMVGLKKSTLSGSTPTAAASAGVSVGLEGGSGGVAGIVDVDASGTITTQGKESHAIHAQSVGGGGGIGGAATNLIIRESTSARVGVGGAGGTGGVGALVDVLSTATLTTNGDDSHGIYAQSIGGGGGTGGLAGLLSLQTGGVAAKGNNSFGLSVGGIGGTGADGGLVNLSNQGNITTNGSKSHAVNAQSVGGGGGDGGLVLNGAISGAGRGTSIVIGVGGEGGTGGNGDSVTVSNQSVINTTGSESVGVQAQSIGGGGGNAGLVANFDINMDAGVKKTASKSLTMNFGGKGGTGGNGGVVTVSNKVGGQIITQGEKAYGVFAQSIGGGGGNGSAVVSANFSSGSDATMSGGLNVGGNGGIGGTGGNVTVNNLDLIDTSGDGAHGVFAQSIGGGGGNGGIALGTNAIFAKGGGKAATFSIGGAGGDGGDASTVTVNNSGQIITRGNNAHGIVAQSIGGGGGNANVGLGVGSNVFTTLIANELSAIIGGINVLSNSGGTGGSVTVNHSGDITVLGEGSQAIKAESINGGGGGMVMDFNGITSLPGGEGLPLLPDGTDPGITTDPVLTIINGGTDLINTKSDKVTVIDTGTYGVGGDNGVGIGINSIGGGGGNLILDLEFHDLQDGGLLDILTQIGGTGGQGNNGNQIDGAHTGDIITNGNHTLGVSIQSIGGGGGRGILDISGQQFGGLGNVDISLGTDGGSNDLGGAINYSQIGDFNTTGNNAIGFLAQSLGAGGGEVHVSGIDNFTVNLGGQNASSGDGGAVNFNLMGNAITTGERSHGVFLQSIGGGGGAVFTGSQSTATVNLSSANSGNGGAINFQLEGDIAVIGFGSIGLFAQSLGGGGGYVDGLGAFSAGGIGAGGSLSIVLNGSVYSNLGAAVYLQSDGSNGGGNITLDLGLGHAIVGGADDATLTMAGGSNNRFTNRGVLASLGEATGLAIQSSSGNDVIDNFGTLMGRIDLGAGINSITNQVSGQMFSGDIDLGGPDNFFNNQGIFSPGGVGLALQTQLNGRYIQEASAIALMDIDFESDVADALFSSGTIEIAGGIDVSLVNPHAIRPGVRSRTLFNAAGGLTDNGVSLMTAPSVVVNYSLDQPSASELALGMDVDFAAHGRLQANRTAFGEYINRVQEAGSSTSLGQLITELVTTGEIARYDNILTQLSPDFYAAQQANSLRTAQQFGRSLMSCSSQDTRYRFVRQGSCTWLRIDTPSTNLNAHDGVPAMDYRGTRTAFGGQVTQGNLTIGTGFSIENFNSSGFANFWSGDGDTSQLGGVIKYQADDVLFTSSLVLGNSNTSVQRAMNIFGPSLSVTEQKLNFYGLTLGFNQRFENPHFIVTPLFELGTARMRANSESEGGAGAIGLQIETFTEKHLWYRQGLEFSQEFEFKTGGALRPYARMNLVHYIQGAESEVRANLNGAPAGVAPMRISNDMGRNQRLFEFGLDYLSLGGHSVQLRYERTLAKNFTNKETIIKFTMPF